MGAGRAPRLGISLEPSLLARPGASRPLTDSTQPLGLEELSQWVEQSELHSKYSNMASASPQLRALRWLRRRLSKLHGRAMGAAGPESSSESAKSADSSGATGD